jgi:hypothetical protein
MLGDKEGEILLLTEGLRLELRLGLSDGLLLGEIEADGERLGETEGLKE